MFVHIGLFTTDFPFKGPFTVETPDGRPYFWGGTAEVVYQLAMALNDAGQKVTVFTISPTGEEMTQKHEKIFVHRYAKKFQVARTWLSFGLLWKPLRESVDLVHGHLGTPPGAFAACVYSVMKRKPFVLTLHTSYNQVALKGGSLARKLALRLSMDVVIKKLLRRADAITTVSLPVMEESPVYQDFIPRATVIPNGVMVRERVTPSEKERCRRKLGIEAGKKVILYMASFSPYKDPETLARAFIELDRRVDPYLVMLGDGPLRASSMDLVKKAGLEDHARFPGFVTEEEKEDYLCAADVFVLPSLAEAFGIAILEAGIYGLPIVTSDIEVFKQLVDGESNGMLFQAGEPSDLRSKLDGLLSQEERMRRLGEQARIDAERYDWDKIVERYFQVYQKVMP